MIEVLSAGLYTTLQDLGRYGYREYGVPVSGAMDRYAAALANNLAGNLPTATLMEITRTGPVLKFNQGLQIAITGAGFIPTVDDRQIPMNMLVRVPAGGILKFGLPAYGMRAYVAVRGGFITEEILGSCSFYQGITENERITVGNVLLAGTSEGLNMRPTASVKTTKTHFTTQAIEAFEGPEFHLFPPDFQKKIKEESLQVLPQSNRMAYLLRGREVIAGKEIITVPVRPGTVQVTPSGQWIVLMRDAQTTGGYARVLQLTEMAINILSQKKPGDWVNFEI